MKALLMIWGSTWTSFGHQEYRFLQAMKYRQVLLHSLKPTPDISLGILQTSVMAGLCF
jgi:hypothetical protein